MLLTGRPPLPFPASASRVCPTRRQPMPSRMALLRFPAERTRPPGQRGNVPASIVILPAIRIERRPEPKEPEWNRLRREAAEARRKRKQREAAEAAQPPKPPPSQA